jgi:ComF family protein
LLGILFPALCLHCGQELDSIAWTGVCPDCWSALEPRAGPGCARCGLPASPHFQEHPSGLCGLCHQGASQFDFARSLTAYEGVARTLIHQLKFRRRERLARKLGECLAFSPAVGGFGQILRFACQAARDEGKNPSAPSALCVVPVPLHRERERERGFNQAEEIAKSFVRKAKRLGVVPRLQLDCKGLLKIRATPPQVGLDFKARQENVRNSFRVASRDRFKEKTVLLVDDVMTTGATASACAQVLTKAGAHCVMVLTVARAVLAQPQTFQARGPMVDDGDTG